MLAEHDGAREFCALLVELDPRLADRARTNAAELGLSAVAVRTADAGADPSVIIRQLFAGQGFREVSFTAPPDARLRVGVHQIEVPPTGIGPLLAGTRMFSFTRR